MIHNIVSKSKNHSLDSSLEDAINAAIEHEAELKPWDGVEVWDWVGESPKLMGKVHNGKWTPAK